MLLLGIDVGTSSIKVSVVDSDTQSAVVSAQFPETESEIKSLKAGWAEQSPDMWWEHVEQAILKAHSTGKYQPKEIGAIGIAYQMHGLVLVDQNLKALRDSIIWCDSRAVGIGERAFHEIGEERSLSRLLNSPGNFTASKLAWVKENEPEIFEQIFKVMLPGDYIAMKLTGEITVSASSLSEGILWDFREDTISADVLKCFGFSRELFPEVRPVFSEHGHVTGEVAERLGLKAGIPVTYKSGDQPNNALSLNVLQPGEVAATAGTSGVIYGVSDTLFYDPQSRVNTFAHVNYTTGAKRLGVLLCINGTGSLNRWIKNNLAGGLSYKEIDTRGKRIPVGAEGLRILPFGNGAERMLNNKMPGAHILNIDLNNHTGDHIFRAEQEGIAFAFRYGLDIMRENGMHPSVIRVGKANLFQSPLFAEAFVNATNVPVELYNNDGSVGAAIGAGIGVKVFVSERDAFANQKPIQLIAPDQPEIYQEIYEDWKSLLLNQLERKSI